MYSCRATLCPLAGELSSDDDFYLLDTGLAVLQTTNGVLNETLFDLLTPQARPLRRAASC